MDEIFDRNLERWAQSSAFINAYVQRALIFAQFVRPVTKFINRNVKEHTQANDPDTQMFGSQLSFPNSSSSSSYFHAEDKDRKRKREKSIESDHPRDNLKPRME